MLIAPSTVSAALSPASPQLAATPRYAAARSHPAPSNGRGLAAATLVAGALATACRLRRRLRSARRQSREPVVHAFGSEFLRRLLDGPQKQPSAARKTSSAEEQEKADTKPRGVFQRLLDGPKHAETVMEATVRRNDELRETLRELDAQEAQCKDDLEAALSQRERTEDDLRLEAFRSQRTRLRELTDRRIAQRKGAAHQAAAPAPTLGAGPRPSAPAPWQAVWHEQSSRWYFFNQQTRQTSWELPAAAARPAEPPKPWRLVSDVRSGRLYYHNVSTNETSWEFPSCTMRH